MPRGEKTADRTNQRRGHSARRRVVTGEGTRMPSDETPPRRSNTDPDIGTGGASKRSGSLRGDLVEGRSGRRSSGPGSSSKSSARRTHGKERGKNQSSARKKPSGNKAAHTRARKSRATGPALRKGGPSSGV